MRDVNGESRAANNTIETINAAATAIASAENRVPQATVQKRRWRSRWSIYWCFGYQKCKRQIGHAVLFPEPPAPGSGAPAAENSAQAPEVTLPFVAPPSSPASFFQSEPPSVTQSPAGLVSRTSISASMYSPSGPASIFAIGPYAHETQLVSPPVFSTFTTEPSTAPFTPPPESVHLTTPSSPEVPFAQFIDPTATLRNGVTGLRFPFDFQSYQFHPGSSGGQLISPSSGISGSGTSSPFPDGEFAVGGPHFPEFRMGEPPKLLNLDKLSTREWGSYQDSGALTPDSVRHGSPNFLLCRQFSDVASHPHSENGHDDDHVVNHRFSFELSVEDASRCVEEKPACSIKTVPEYLENGTKAKEEENYGELIQSFERRSGDTSNDTPETPSTDGEAPQHRKQQPITLGSVNEFNFDNADGGDSHKPSSSNWWAHGSVIGKEGETTKNWSFFSVVQSDVS